MALNFFVVAVLLLTQSGPNRSVTPQFSSPSRAFAYANAPREELMALFTWFPKCSAEAPLSQSRWDWSTSGTLIQNMRVARWPIDTSLMAWLLGTPDTKGRRQRCFPLTATRIVGRLRFLYRNPARPPIFLAVHEIAIAAELAIAARAAEKPAPHALTDRPAPDIGTMRIDAPDDFMARDARLIDWEEPFNRACIRVADPARLDANAYLIWAGIQKRLSYFRELSRSRDLDRSVCFVHIASDFV